LLLFLNLVRFPLLITEPQSSFWSGAAPQWFAALGTFVLAFVAVFQEWLRRLVICPVLKLEARVSRPDCHKTTWTAGYKVYYFRLRVENTGNDAAHDVQVYLASVERLRLDKTYEPAPRFDPMNLLWALTRKPTLPTLLPKMPPRYCDLAHITDPLGKLSLKEDLPGVGENDPVLALDLEASTNRKGHLLEAGVYRFGIKLAAANHPAHDYTLEVDFRGLWIDDEDKMLREGFGMRLVNRSTSPAGRPILPDSQGRVRAEASRSRPPASKLQLL
jgi:hypothetical protein